MIKRIFQIFLLFILPLSETVPQQKHTIKSETATETDNFIRGADVSYIPQIEDLGGVYRENQAAKDPLEIFRDNGMNYIRLRLWHSPPEGYNGLEKTIAMAIRVKALGMKFLLNFHYSDSWADPGKQTKPAAWSGLTYNVLKDSVYQYSKDVILSFKNQGVLPNMVQIGNEIISGMLWNDGRVGGSFDTDAQWAKFGGLLKEGIRGVRAAIDSADTIKIMIHIDRGGSNSASRWFFDNVTQQNVDFDIIGQSFYPWWHGTLTQLESNINDLPARYNKEIIVVETAYPWTLNWVNDGGNNFVWNSSQLHAGYPASFSGQRSFMIDLMTIVRNVPNNMGTGVFYWAPEYISVEPFGSIWENVTLFSFLGNVLPAIEAFNPKIVKVEEENSIPSNFELFQNFPNPFNPETQIEFMIPIRSNVKLSIYNLIGQEVASISKRNMQVGNHHFSWDASNFPSGIYIYKLQVGETSQTRKMVLLK